MEYKGIDNNGNKFVIFSEYSDFKKIYPELINMEKTLFVIFISKMALF